MDVSSVEAVLFGIHLSLATITKTPELLLTEKEAKDLASAAANVAKFYDVSASEKTLAWSGLIITAATIYGPRVVAIMMRERAQPQPAAPNVTPFRAAPGRAGRPTPGATTVNIPGVGSVDVPTE